MERKSTSKQVSNEFALKSMQQRIETIRQRKSLITKVKQNRKATVILRLQVANLEKNPLTDIYKSKRQELNSKTRELKRLESDYMKLAHDELDILKSHLRKTMSHIESIETQDIDIEDRRFSLQHTIWVLQQEMDMTMK